MDTMIMPQFSMPPDSGGQGQRDKKGEDKPKRNWRRWFGGRWARRQRANTLLPQVMQVMAGFSKLDGDVAEAEIDAALGFLRYDFPEAWHAELQGTYQRALSEPQDVQALAGSLSRQLTQEEKMLLGIQLYLLISRSRQPKSLLRHYYIFMTSLGVSTEAVGIAAQLNLTSEHGPGRGENEAGLLPETRQPLECVTISGAAEADVALDGLKAGQSMAVFRFRNLLLLKNTGESPVIARGRQVRGGEFSRLYAGQRVVVGECVLEYQDLTAYLNAKKDVLSTQLYVSVDQAGRPFVEKEESNDAIFQVKFGLYVEVHCLAETHARVRGAKLRPGEHMKAGLNDKISFPDRTEITLAELRRRAREMGGRFSLNPARADYLVSTNSELLRPGDILLSASARGELLLKITCDYESKSGELEVLKADRPVFVRQQPIKERTRLADGDAIDMGEGMVLRCRFGDRVIEEERNIIAKLQVEGLIHKFGKTDTAMDGITFSVQRGEMICVMGPSGCGKSTLLRALAGHLKPQEGLVRYNGIDLYDDLRDLRPYIAYIPHEDAFDPLLTVEENLEFSAAVRSPNLGPTDRRRRVEAKLAELGLAASRNRRAGMPEDKWLSGGERKRLNIGLDMIGPADVFLFDEPTSGLSSKDSEHVLDILRGLSHNKIVFVSIHQPSARLFQLFHKALLLDRGGRVAFFGTPDEMLAYFRQAAQEEQVPLDLPAGGANCEAVWAPEMIFDVMESPLREFGGDIIYSPDERGNLAPARRFSPGYWRDRFQAIQIMVNARGGSSSGKSMTSGQLPNEPAVPTRRPCPPRRHLRDEVSQLWALIKRVFISKLRHRTNLATTLLEAPLLALLIASVLRYSEDGAYTFATAFHVPTYLFLSLVVSMFLGLTNSADDIVRDRVQLQRERNHNVRVIWYIAAKIVSLGFFALVQCVIYLLIGNFILEIRDMFFYHLLWMGLTALTGVVSGLVISSIVNEGKTAINLIPLILIPQIILGGALIKYEEMNRNLNLVHNLSRWFKDEEGKKAEPSNKLEVPFLCEFMPLRWSYEGLIISQAELNPREAIHSELQRRRDQLLKELPPPPAKLTVEQRRRIDAVKDAIAYVSGLEARSPDALKRKLDKVLPAVDLGLFDPDMEDFVIKEADRQVSGTSVYENQKVWDLFHKAENERLSDSYEQPPNVFFGLEKTYFKKRCSTLTANAIVLGAIIALGLIVLYASLRWRLTRV